MSERTERSEGHEQTAPDGDADAPEQEPLIRSGRRADSRRAPRPHRPPNALGPFIPQDPE
jgi:hypothetical protein